MTYRHKRDPCVKDTKEIVENILRMKSSDYELTDHSDIVTSRKSILLQKVIEQEVNRLPHESEDDTDENNREKDVKDEDCIIIENLETYQPIQELDFEVSEVKECFEKKKKRRNYIEFRPDYSKIS